ncbi:Flp pilus assembly complex ATPase component TadA [Candidatus Parcubacteria bacterium]|nr:Flp pilus assembly complex ATPase component TadA [Candidatus Parcubacteria bacterium]
MFTDKQLKDILIHNEILTIQNFDKFQKEAKTLGKSMQNYVIEKKYVTENSLYQSAASFYKIPFINLKNQKIRKDVLFIVPEPIAITHKIISFDSSETEIKIATTNPEKLQIFEFIQKKTGLKPIIHLTSPSNVKEVLKQYHKSLKAEFDYLTDDQSAGNENQKDLKKLAHDLPVVRIVETLLEYSIMEGASDIHIEPEEKDVLVRYRVDGTLHSVMVLPKQVQSGIIARIKILANLKVDEHRMPQDGRFKIATNEYKVAFRVSILPTFDGEKIVMRLLNENAQVLSLEQLGFQTKPLEIIKLNIKKPNGIMLVTGPTGSGKTTTLYTILNILNTPEVNISTIEDPVEYRMKHVNQSQVNSKIGYSFAEGLRSFLRQDPDIIMVGEIRDKETAEIAAHAAMTGHSVLSTIHTNSAAATMPRLSEMGIPTFLIASTVNIIIAQRLVRKICSNCIQSYNLDEEEIKQLEKQLNINSILDTLMKEKMIINKKGGLKSLLFFRGKGCKQCNNTGYKGRMGIYEVLENKDEISGMILKNAPTMEIKQKAVEMGMLTMVEDGFLKAKKGVTTIEEIMRVTKE